MDILVLVQVFSLFFFFLFFFKNCIILGMLWLSGIMAVEYNYPE